MPTTQEMTSKKLRYFLVLNLFNPLFKSPISYVFPIVGIHTVLALNQKEGVFSFLLSSIKPNSKDIEI